MNIQLELRKKGSIVITKEQATKFRRELREKGYIQHQYYDRGVTWTTHDKNNHRIIVELHRDGSYEVRKNFKENI